jgi:uncharacterized protein DUF669
MPTYTEGLGGALPEGVYDFTVMDAVNKQSQSGNDMIELQLIIKGPDGQENKVYDNLVFTSKASWKIDHFRIASGETLVKGQSVEFNDTDCLDRTGKCYVIVDNYEGRERNKVDDYLDPAAINNSHTSQQAVKPQKPASPPIDDDDIPVD